MDAQNMFESNQNDGRNEDDQQQMDVVGAPIYEQKPDIFNLDDDCFGEVFDWLSLEDLHAFGQTCKRMQQVAGYYFRQTYSGARIYCLENRIECNDFQLNGFGDFLQSIEMNFDILNQFCFAHSNELKSLKKVSISGTVYPDEFIGWIKKHLSKAEVLCLEFFELYKNFYKDFLQFCPNIKYLSVTAFNVSFENGYNWLLECYPSLEKLVLNPIFNDQRIDELTTFFNRNPNVQHFATTEQILLVNRHLIVASNIKLDTLAINFTQKLGKDEMRNLLNEFYEREIFKRLHIYVDSEADDVVNRIDQTNCVEKITYRMLPMDIPSLPFVNLKEFYSRYIRDDSDMDVVARTLVNLELVCFKFSTLIQVFPFIRHSRKLKHIGIETIDRNEQHKFDLFLWNEERKKLCSPRKVSIHVNEEFFLTIKEATQNRNYSLIEIKRIDSFRLFFDFPNIF